MREYLEHFATRLGLHSDIQFNSRVSALQWDEEGQFWDVTVDGHPNVRARHVVLRFRNIVIQTDVVYGFGSGIYVA